MMKFLSEEAERGKTHPSPIPWQHTIQAYNPSGPQMRPIYYMRPHLPTRKRRNDFDSWGGRSGFSDRILRHVLTLEDMGVKARHASLVVTPSYGMWKKMGNRSFLHKYGLYYVNETTHPSSVTKGAQEAINDVSLGKVIDKAIGRAPKDEPHQTRIFVKDGTYPMINGLTLPTGKYLEGETQNGTVLQLTSGSSASWVLQSANGASGANRCDLYNLTLDANNTPSGGLHFQGAGSTLPQRYWNLSMRKLRVTNFQGLGVELLDTANLFEGVQVCIDSTFNTALSAMHIDAPDSTFLSTVFESEYIGLYAESGTSGYFGDCYLGGTSNSAEQILLQATQYTNIHNCRNDFASSENLYILDESGTPATLTSIIGGIISNGSEAATGTYPAIRVDNATTVLSNTTIVGTGFFTSTGLTQPVNILWSTSSHNAIQLSDCMIAAAATSGPIIPASTTNFVVGTVAYRQNHLFNPFGVIASPFDNTNNAMGITQGGTTAAIPTTGTTYTVNGVDLKYYITGGTSPTISINGTSVPCIAASQNYYDLSVGDKVAFGGTVSTVTNKVFGK